MDNYKKVPIQATVKKPWDDATYKLEKCQWKQDLLMYDKLVSAQNRGEKDGHQHWKYQELIGHKKDPENKCNWKGKTEACSKR